MRHAHSYLKKSVTVVFIFIEIRSMVQASPHINLYSNYRRPHKTYCTFVQNFPRSIMVHLKIHSYYLAGFAGGFTGGVNIF